MPRTAALLTTSIGAGAVSSSQIDFTWATLPASPAEKSARSHWRPLYFAGSSRTAARFKHQPSAPAANPLHIAAPHGTTSRVMMATSSSVCRAGYPATNLPAAVTKYVGCAWGDVLANPTVFLLGAACAAIGGVGLLPQCSHGGRGRTSACRIAMVSVGNLCMRCVQSLLSVLCLFFHDILVVFFTTNMNTGTSIMFLLIFFTLFVISYFYETRCTTVVVGLVRVLIDRALIIFFCKYSREEDRSTAVVLLISYSSSRAFYCWHESYRVEIPS